MTGPGILLAKLTAAVISDERTRKAIGWGITAVLAPIFLIVALILSLLSGSTEHNNAAVDLVFNGGVFPPTINTEFATQVQSMRACLSMLDGTISAVNDELESGTLDGPMIKSIFFSLRFGDENLNLSAVDARAFVDCFVRYETRTRTVEAGTDPITNETLYTEEEYTVAVAISTESSYANLSATGYSVSDTLEKNAHAVYIRIAYGSGGGYAGDIEYGGNQTLELDITSFIDPTAKNSEDLVEYATYAWESGWGYVWGTYGNVLTESLLDYKIQQYPDGVGNRQELIRKRWLGGRTTDCVGLIKGYGWLDPKSLSIRYGTNGMPDIGADAMFKSATRKGGMDSMPDTPGLAVWKSGHIGVYIGNGEVIEAMGTNYGVVKTKLSERSWSAWLEIPYINYK